MSSLARYAWFTLIVNVLTVVGGTVVRATGSGAGCGRHWPTCQGEVLPGLGEVATRIEFSHRMMTGLALVTVAVLVLWVFRQEPKGTQRRRAAFLSGVAILIEALLGAYLVLAELVADDASVARAVSVPLHLVNTFFLIGALTTTAWLLGGDRRLRWHGTDRTPLMLGMAGLLLIGASGAVTALADTLFPAESLAEGIIADFDAKAHFLTRLRVIHPIVAILAGAFILWFAQRRKDRAGRAASTVAVLVVVQWTIGLVNVVTLTPLVSQIVHLAVANVLLVAWIILGAGLLRVPSPQQVDSDTVA